MITTYILINRLKSVVAWILQYKTVLLVALCALLFLYIYWSVDRSPRNIEIVVPHQEIERLHQQRIKQLEQELQEADRIRDETDRKIRELKEKTRRGNVTAKELEDLLK